MQLVPTDAQSQLDAKLLTYFRQTITRANWDSRGQEPLLNAQVLNLDFPRTINTNCDLNFAEESLLNSISENLIVVRSFATWLNSLWHSDAIWRPKNWFR